MADEVNVSFLLPGEPPTHVAAWREAPPPFLHDYKRVDESYESLVYESNVTSTFTRWATFGMGKTLYRLAFGSVITVATEDGTGAAEIAPYVDIPLERMAGSEDRPASARAWLEAIVQHVDFCRDVRSVVRSARHAR